MVKPGYKQTEIGVIPQEWTCAKIEDIATILMCKRIFADQTTENGEIPFYKIGTFGKEADAYISVALYNEYKNKFSFPKQGDVLISAAGTLGRTVVYDGKDAYFQDSNIVWLDIDKNVLCNEYLNHYYRVIKWASSEGSTIARLYNGIIYATNITLPPLEEQKRIAEALSDVDSMISSLEKLIAKKKAVKQGAMQELLTGKKRLPGFTREWKTYKLDEIAKIIMGQSPDSKFYNVSEGIPLIQGNADISSRKTQVRFYTTQITKTAFAGDLIFTVRAPVGNVAKTSFDCCIGRGVCALRGYTDFLFHYLVYIEPYWATLSAGSTFDSINSNTLANTELLIPSDIEEQNAIASILSDMDYEIEALEQKLAKTRHVKQGMMQQLLTGKIRLI